MGIKGRSCMTREELVAALASWLVEKGADSAVIRLVRIGRDGVDDSVLVYLDIETRVGTGA